MNRANILLLHQVGMHDLDLVGEKNALLGEMLQHVTKTGINIPPGFVITVNAYRSFISYNGLDAVIGSIITEIDFADPGSFQKAGQKIRSLISHASFPPELAQEIIDTYFELSESCGHDATDVAVRASIVTEELPDAAVARLHETCLNVRTPAALIDAIRHCFASLFTGRAMLYRLNHGIDHVNAGIAVGVQKMVRSDLGTSGMAFSLSTENGFKDAIVINASYGLGQLIVQGDVLPDSYVIHKPALKTAFSLINEKRMGVKDKIMVYGDEANERVKVIAAERELQSRFCLEDAAVLQLAEWIIKIEAYYSSLFGKYTPMDIEWAMDGLSKELFIVQARPGTIHAGMSNIEYPISNACPSVA
jgi:pyruvate, water dikinase